MIWIYRGLVLPIALLGLYLLSIFDRKLRAVLTMRQPIEGRPYWSKLKVHAPHVWIHCASGEFEYAKPMIRELKSKYPRLKIVVTYTSISFQKQIQSFVEIDDSLPLPLDTPGAMHSFLNALRPNLLLIARTDLWPELLWQCQQRKIPVSVFSVTQSPISKFSVRGILKSILYGWVEKIYCVSAADAQELLKIARPDQVMTIGDTRYDQVTWRLKKTPPEVMRLQPSSRPRIIFGSTWPEDEKVLLQSLAGMPEKKQAQWIWVPHELHPEHLLQLENRLRQIGLSCERYSQLKDQTVDVVIVDKMGLLADLYKIGQAAFVGGSFKKLVHSVMEPLAAGLPVIVGPYYRNNREAVEFSHIPLPQEEMRAVTVAKDAARLKLCLEAALKFKNPQISKDFLMNLVLDRSGSTHRLINELAPKIEANL